MIFDFLKDLYKPKYKATFYMKSGSKIIMRNLLSATVNSNHETKIISYKMNLASGSHPIYSINLDEVEAVIIENQ